MIWLTGVMFDIIKFLYTVKHNTIHYNVSGIWSDIKEILVFVAKMGIPPKKMGIPPKSSIPQSHQQEEDYGA